MSWLLATLLLSCGPSAAQEDGSSANPGLIQPGGMMIFYASEGPLSFITLTPGELPPGARDAGEVKGRTCQHGVSIPITASIRPTTVSGAAGEGGYRKTVAEILRLHQGPAGIYDVKVDVQVLSILGFYRRLCTEITARGYRIGSQP